MVVVARGAALVDEGDRLVLGDLGEGFLAQRTLVADLGAVAEGVGEAVVIGLGDDLVEAEAVGVVGEPLGDVGAVAEAHRLQHRDGAGFILRLHEADGAEHADLRLVRLHGDDEPRVVVGDLDLDRYAELVAQERSQLLAVGDDLVDVR